MDSNFKAYDFLASYARIDGILSAPTGLFEEVDALPDRDTLTYSNGFYANCVALFVDIRDSSKLPDAYTRPVLAKIYRSFISEMVAILNSDVWAREVNIVGDCVWAVYKVTIQAHMDTIFNLAAKANALVQVLNYKMRQRGWNTPIRIGIGLAYGRALMIKAGYNGSGISEVVYMGDVVNRASKLAAKGSTNFTRTIVADADFHYNLNAENKSFFATSFSPSELHCDVVDTDMNEWFKVNCV